MTLVGKPRYYVAKSIGPGARAKMPAGFEFSEGVNGVVSVRRVDNTPKLVADSDAELVRSEVARHRHLRYHRVEVGKAEIVIYEPIGALSDAGVQRTSEAFGLMPSFVESRMSALQAKARYAPVMKFVAGALGGSSEYAVHRMRYRGEGGWSYPLAHGPLSNLVRDFVRHVGTQKFFDLY